MRNHQDPTPDAPEPAQQGGTRAPNLAQPFQPTPEPWKIAHSNYANAPFVIYVGDIDPKWDRRYPLTGVDWIAEVKHDESEQHQEQIANARLIAAAPRMLRALKFLCQPIAFEELGKPGVKEALDQAWVDAHELLRELEGGAR